MNTTINEAAPKITNIREELNGAQVIVNLLEQQGVSHVFGIPGGSNLPLYDALSASSIQHVLARHEQGAGFMAQGLARVSGMPAVCFASSGPGATNLLTAIADAKMDSIPLVAITGQVAQHLIGTDAFQEVDTVALMRPITKFCCQARSVEELLELIPSAFAKALEGRPGPVAIDIPKDVQLQPLRTDCNVVQRTVYRSPVLEQSIVADILHRIDQAKKPLLMVGAGVIKAGAAEDLRRFVEQRELAVVHTLHGLGALPGDHPMSLGMMGMHAARYTNQVLDECDLLIGLGVRFDDRATGLANAFCPQADIIHVDIDPSEFGKIISPSLAVHADVGELLRALNAMDAPDVRSKHTGKPLWKQRYSQLKDACPPFGHGNDSSPFTPYGAIKAVAERVPGAPLITTDVGQHQMWLAQAYPFQFAGQLITSGGLGTMGFGLPAAIGCAFANPSSTILCFTGDGSLMMNIQELATAAEHDLNIKILVFNNGHLGMVRQQQKLFYQENYQAIEFRQQTDFVMAANSMGVPALDLHHCENAHETLRDALQSKGPCLVNIPISEEEMVFPMVPPGGANSEMIESAY